MNSRSVQKKLSPKAISEFTIKDLKEWHRNPLVNPKTKRKIKKDGPTYALLKHAYNNMQTGVRSIVYQIGMATHLPKDEDRFILKQNNGFLWASVFDGHGGKDVSTFLHKNAIKVFKKISETSNSMEQSLSGTYEALERAIQQNNLSSGSTGSTILIHPKNQKLYIAHVGDSRIIARRNKRAIALTNDHKPNQMNEYKRIRAAGDTIVHHGVWRIGSLAVSRVFGDIDIKRNYPSVIATPDITSINMKGIDCIVLGSDGLYDVCTNEDIMNFIENRRGKAMNEIAKELVLHARNRGSLDDITVIIICF